MFDLEKPKWIIQDRELRLGRVVAHEDLTKENGDGGVKGGGLWYYEKETNSLYLYGKSYDYGQASADDFEDVWVRPSLEKSKIYFSKAMSLELAKTNNTIVQDFDDENINAN